jgi:hypothetical protein
MQVDDPLIYPLTVEGSLWLFFPILVVRGTPDSCASTKLDEEGVLRGVIGVCILSFEACFIHGSKSRRV